VHPDLAAPLYELVVTARANKCALVHGDVSPKNILVGPNGPVFLDAECAWWGDPAFDLAFCLNHLLLSASGRHRRAQGFSPASMPWWPLIERALLGNPAMCWKRGPRDFCRGCCLRG
jgi:aminoglycoside phosphotransferase (APT) family kinase protein